MTSVLHPFFTHLDLLHVCGKLTLMDTNMRIKTISEVNIKSGLLFTLTVKGVTILFLHL